LKSEDNSEITTKLTLKGSFEPPSGMSKRRERDNEETDKIIYSTKSFKMNSLRLIFDFTTFVGSTIHSSPLSSSDSLEIERIIIEKTNNCLLSFYFVTCVKGSLIMKEIQFNPSLSSSFSSFYSPLLILPSLPLVHLENVIFSNFDLSSSLISFPSPSHHSQQERDRNEKERKRKIEVNYLPSPTFLLQNSSFTRIKGTNKPILLHNPTDTDLGVFKIKNSTFNTLSSPESKEGGGFSLFLSSDGWITFDNSTIRECEANKTPLPSSDRKKKEKRKNEVNENLGRGGGIYLETDTSSSFPLHLLFQELILSVNEATIGRDLYMVCYSIEEQINETLFVSSDITSDSFNRVNSIYGREEKEGKKGEDEDLMKFMIPFESSTVFVSYNGNPLIPSEQCGSEESPCLSLSLALSHLIPSYENRIFVKKGVNIEEGVKIKNMIVKGREKEKAEIVIGGGVLKVNGLNGMFDCEENVTFEKLHFILPSALSFF
jgi:hypothetical protein